MSLDLSPRAAERLRRDDELLAWIGRFRFVTATLVAERFGVSVEKTNKRIRRLAADGLLARRRGFPDEHYAIFLTGKGAARVGLPVRHAPRAEVQREHELCIVWLASRLERVGHTTRTDRECRQLEARTERRVRRSVDLEVNAGRRDRRRWPDLVVERPEGPLAIEIELTPKGSDRLAAIINAYLVSDVFRDVSYLLTDPALAARVTRVAADQAATTRRLIYPPAPTRLVTTAWPAADPRQQRHVTAAIAAARTNGDNDDRHPTSPGARRESDV